MKKGFTLAEVLITLGIVGIVAVLTIPGVMKNYQNRIYTAQLEKVYAQISEATQSIMNDEHVDNFYETTARSADTFDPTSGEPTGGVAYFLTKYFKYIKKNCANATDDACLSSNEDVYTAIDGSAASGYGSYAIQTVTGAAIGGAYNGTNNCTSLVVDVNGITGPNIAGRDVFAMDILPNGTVVDFGGGCTPGGAGAAANTCSTAAGSTSLSSFASGCLNSVMQSGWKMEY